MCHNNRSLREAALRHGEHDCNLLGSMHRRRIAGAKMSCIASACRYSWRIPFDGRGAGSDHASLGGISAAVEWNMGCVSGERGYWVSFYPGKAPYMGVVVALTWNWCRFPSHAIAVTDHGEENTSANCMKLLESNVCLPLVENTFVYTVEVNRVGCLVRRKSSFRTTCGMF